jgi:hypothetical protein
VLSQRALGVIGVVVLGQLLIGLFVTAALVAARTRMGNRTFVQVAVIIGFVVSFAVATGLSAVNSACGGSEAVTAGLLWYVGGGWVVVQVAIVVWVVGVWVRNRRG